MGKIIDGMKNVALASLIGLASLVPSAKADNLRVDQIPQDVSIGGSINNLKHTSGASDGFDSFDTPWTNALPSFNKVTRFATLPDYVLTKVDSHSLSEAPFLGQLYGVITNGVGTISTPISLKFSFISQDTSRLYLAKIHCDSAYSLTGQSFDTITNINQVIANGNFVQLPGITNVPNNTVYGTLDVSSVFTNQTRDIGKNMAIDVELMKDQVSGLESVVLSGPAHGSFVSGIYTPNSNFVGSDVIQTRLREAANTNNTLGDIAYNINVTNINYCPITSDGALTTGKNISFLYTFPTVDPNAYSFTNFIESNPTNGTATLTNNGTKVIYTPNPGFSGSDSLKYYAKNSAGMNSETTNTISLNTTNLINNSPTPYFFSTELLGLNTTGGGTDIRLGAMVPTNRPYILRSKTNGGTWQNVETNITSGTANSNGLTTKYFDRPLDHPSIPTGVNYFWGQSRTGYVTETKFDVIVP